MRLAASTRLGPYEILEPIGAGGMGEVYKARDTRLDRTVAIKVLPAHIAERSEVRQRFEREARAVSSLNHPHICSLYDIGQQDGIDYLVMEYLVGETLAKRLEKGPLPLDQVLRYGWQIADALAQAHQQGVSHRDLKPGNIMLVKAGTKLLDFGLAKLRGKEKGGLDSQAPTLTVEGMILGTFQYMAPEQVQGHDTDARADIFSFGAVLYEMSTGKTAFKGATMADLITAIMSTEPPALSTVVPSAVRPQGLALERAIRRCMAKNPDERWQSSSDLAAELQWITEFATLAAMGGETPAPKPTGNRERVAWGVAALAVLAAVLVGVAYFRSPAADNRPVRLFLAPPENTTLTGSIAVSPDGRQLALVATAADGTSSLLLRPLESLDARPLPGTEGALYPFWSPDSRFVAFFAEGKLKKVRVEGGPPQTLCDVFFDARGGTWSRAGVILFSPNVGVPLYRIPDSGGTPAPVTKLEPSRQESSHQWPHFLPDGKHFLYLVWSAQPDARGVYVGSLDQQAPKRLMAADWSVGYARGPTDSGYLLFLRGRTLLAQSFDDAALQLSGEPTPIAENAWYDLTSPGLTSFSVSDNGVLAYRSGAIRGTQLSWADRTGKRLENIGKPGAYADLSLSPDEKRVVLASRDPQTGTRDVWILDWGRDITSRLTSHPLDDAFPLWSPDGERIVFSSDRAGGPNLFEKAASGSGAEETILTSPVSKYATSWTRDGRYIVYATWANKTAWDLWILPRFGDRKPFPYLETDFDAFQAQFSPDARWIAYVSNETNRHEVNVQPFPTSAGRRWQISPRGGAQPSWRGDGKELYYLAPDKKLMAVEIKPGATFEFGTPRPLFQTQITHLVDARNHYAPSRDGQRFLVNNIVGESSATPITVVLNWRSAK